MEEMTTIQDECILMGAPRVIKKNANYLLDIIQRIVKNYDNADFDAVAFMADIQLAKDNLATITEAAEQTKAVLTKLRHELSDTYTPKAE